jgi:hypothetical protein
MTVENRRKLRLFRNLMPILLCAALVSIALWRLREPLLLERATRVTSAAGWNRAAFNNEISAHWWLSDREILSYRTGPGKSMHFFRRDIFTQQETPLPALDRRLHDYRAGYEMTVSPDGTWILWGGPEEGWHSMAIRLDGSAMMKTPYDRNSSPHWLDGSRHWVNLFINWQQEQWVGGEVYDTAAPNRPPRKVAIGQPNRAGRGWVYITPDSRMVWINRWQRINGFDPEILFSEAGFDANRMPRRNYRIVLPHAATVKGYLYSPDGHRIAWLLSIAHTSPIAAFVKRFLPKFHVATERTDSLWVSRLDGGDFHEIGMVSDKISQHQPGLSCMRWLPSGRRISFLYQDAIWTVPVN